MRTRQERSLDGGLRLFKDQVERLIVMDSMVVELQYQDGTVVRIRLRESVFARFEGGTFTFVEQDPVELAYRKLIKSAKPLQLTKEVALN